MKWGFTTSEDQSKKQKVLWESKSFGCGRECEHPIRWFSGRRTLTSKDLQWSTS
jgi:hypothetical protein